MYEFPPQTWYMQGWWPTLWHCGVLVVGLGLMLQFVRKKHKLQITDPSLILLIALGTSFLLTLPTAAPWEPFRGAHPLVFIITWLVALSCIISNGRLTVKNQGEAAMRWSIGLASLIFSLMLITLFPVSYPREAARRTQCKYYLKQIGRALHNYHDTYRTFPPHKSGSPPYSWRVATLPYFDSSPLYSQYNFEEHWNKGTNRRIAETELGYLMCPSVPRDSPRISYPRTDYFAVTGEETAWPDSGVNRLSDFSDGSSNTLLVVEACGKQEIPWCEPRDLELTDETLGINLPGLEPHSSPGIISSYHRIGANVLFADGATRFLSEETEPAVLKAMLTRSSKDDSGEF
ncbi:DUF1559 domain-containing protein [Thalassoglobus neptunius]|uniref:DUF1559 domain-containing protein n=1 Tax=Thalassoglobus neptunius TaxID=1938619 RepID=UPI0018D22C63|nr:DUF1559 domain-containing protein [Thalassoglobus neptunius]